MPRARNIKPGFFQNESIVELSYEYRLLFIGLWTLADREGRLEYRPKKIKMQLFPADNIDVEDGISELISGKFAIRYEVDNNQYIQIVNFHKHQNPHHQEKESSLPPPPYPEVIPDESGGNPADSGFLIPDSGFLKHQNKHEKTKRFKKPTLEDLLKFIEEKTGSKNEILANKFFNHYEANGWKVGRNSMKSWQAAINQWLSRETSQSTSKELIL